MRPRDWIPEAGVITLAVLALITGFTPVWWLWPVAAAVYAGAVIFQNYTIKTYEGMVDRLLAEKRERQL